MNKKVFTLLLVSLSLTGCAKTNDLYKRSDYNSPVFDENYYESWDGVDKFETNKVLGMISNINNFTDFGVVNLKKDDIDFNQEKYVWFDFENEDHHNEFGYNKNLAKTAKNKEFKEGVLSKLFDGRVRCENMYQLSRVQLNSTGFAMKFSKKLLSAKYLAFACRGGTNFGNDEFGKKRISLDFKWSFYSKSELPGIYKETVFNLNDVLVPVDDGGNTTLISFTSSIFSNDFKNELNGAEAMSFVWNLHEEDDKIVDDYKNNEKEHHMALMLYEIFIGESEWAN